MTSVKQFKYPGHTPFIFMAVSIAILLTLGSWQVQRMQWKEGVLAAVERGQTWPPIAIIPTDERELEDSLYRRVALAGFYLEDHLFFRIGRHPNYTQGYYVMQPYRLLDTDQTILVNRGFVPGTQEEALSVLQAQPVPPNASVTGILRRAYTPRLFTPDNQPDRNLWFSEDTDHLSKIVDTPLLPLAIDATGTVARGQFPLPSDGQVHLRNDHLAYAVTWFMLAAVGIIMFAFYCRKEPAKTEAKKDPAKKPATKKPAAKTKASTPAKNPSTKPKPDKKT